MSQKVIPPSKHQIQSIAASLGMAMSDKEAIIYADFIAPITKQYDQLDQLDDSIPVSPYERTIGWAPKKEENPYNAWQWRTCIKGAPEGILAGESIAIKDNISIAGVPMMNGTRLLENYVPTTDATVVTRVLNAGATITGKSSCEALCTSSQSYTGENGVVRNPHNPLYSTGGSSSGNAALIASGEVSMAIGGDQGGSLRTPAAWCGIYGLKPSWGLVPVTGAMPITYCMDHLGPMCDSPTNIARLLTVIAGPDRGDPRTALSKPQNYLAALEDNIDGLKIGILQEGFNHPNSDPESDAIVINAIQQFARLGASITTINLPMHYDAMAIHTGLVMEGITDALFDGNGQGTQWNGFYSRSLIEAFGNSWRNNPDQIPYTTKAMLLIGKHMQQKYHGKYQAKAQNLRLKLIDAYDELFQDVDIIAMPTIPHTASKILELDSLSDQLNNAANMLQNTIPFDVTGHPAISLPCGMLNGLPVGLMLVGRQMDDAQLITAAQQFSIHYDWMMNRRK